MTRLLREHALALQDALRRLGGQFVAAFLNLLVIGIALSLPLAMYVVLGNVSAFSRQAAAEPQLTLFLQPDADASAAPGVESRLKNHPAIGRYQFVAKANALEELKKAAGLSGIVEELGRNPLPDAFVVTGRPDGAEALEALRAEAAKWPGVDHAQLDTLWARQVEAVIRGGRMVVVILGTLLGVALVAITFNTIRLQILGRREEIEVSKLIGATNAFIRRPFLYLGTLQGLIGACIAWGLVMFAVGALERELGVAASLIAQDGVLRRLDLRDSVALAALAGGLGWFGAWLSVTLHLRRFDPV
jgi:cell division transport system permease protein